MSIAMSQSEILQATIATERALLQNHEEKLTVSTYYAELCQRGLGHLQDAEQCIKNDDLGVAQMALNEAVNARKKVDEAVGQRGYGVINPTEKGL